MRLVRFNRHVEAPVLARLGCVLEGEIVVDLRAAYARFLQEDGDSQGSALAALRMPPAISSFLQSEEAGRRALASMAVWLRALLRAEPEAAGLVGEKLFAPLAECRLHAPVRLTKLVLAVSDEGGAAAPSLVMKPPSAVVGPARDVTMPAGLARLGFAAGLGIVMARKCKNLGEREARGAVAGYTVITDIRAAGEEAAGLDAFSARMFESFAPSGPWLISADEIEKPETLRVTAAVNGKPCQDYTLDTAGPGIWRAVAAASRMTLEPADMVWVGTARQIAAPVTLGKGDVVEAAVAGIGALRNTVV